MFNVPELLILKGTHSLDITDSYPYLYSVMSELQWDS